MSSEPFWVGERFRIRTLTACFPAGSTRLLTLPAIHQVGSSLRRTYTLKVRGRRGSVQLFSNSTELHVDPRGVSTFIQTNQPRYLPGQVVKIRTVSVRSDGKPCSEPADVLIRDPRGSLLRQWLDKDGVLGVVSTEFQLSENPPLGEWSIMATVEGISSVKHFSVDYYVLPKFEVLVKVPEVVHREDVLKGFVSAKYFYGKPVRGRMVVTFSHRYHGDDQTHSLEAEVDGSGKFRFLVSTFSPSWSRMMIRDERPDFLSVQVSVTEHLTGLTCNNTVSVALAQSRFSVAFEDFPKVLRPSLSFSGTLKVSTYNGEPLQDQTLLVSVKQQRSQETWDEQILFPKNSSDSSWMNWDQSSSEDMELPVPVDGLVPLHIQVQKDTQSLTVEVSLEDCQKTLSVDRSFRSQSGAYLQVQRPSSPAQVGSRLRLRVEKNFGIPYVHYLVKSRGQVVSAGSSSGDVSLVPTASWAPLASVVVYCVHPGGEVINDVIHLPITHFLQNKVSLRWSSDRLKPAEVVTLNVSVAEPDSLVGILVVDKATRWAGSNNDFTMETLREQMTESSMNDALRDEMTMGDPFSVFQTCDLTVMTDASVPRADPTWLLLTEDDPGFFLQTDGEHFRKQPEPHQRQNFPETWVWMDVNTGDSNRMQISLPVPDSITTWTASAFVMTENLGLGLTEKPAELTVFQDFFLSLNLPAYIIRGEELVLEVVLFNYLQEELEVTVIIAESDAFEFVFPDSEAVAMASVRRLLVEPEGGATVLVPVRPLVLGDVPIAVKAVSSAAADFVRTTVLVKAEGRPQSFSSSLLLDLPASRSGSVAFRFPPGVVDGSQRVSVTAIDGVPTWSSPDAGLSSSWQPRSADIEMASYVLLSLHQLNRVDEGLSLMKWLSQQRNHLGGYGSTQDTVVALQALSTFAALQGSERSYLDVTVTNGDSDVVADFHIDQDNMLLLQSRQIDPEPVLDLQVTASGHGFALFQLNVFYNVRSEELLRRRKDAEEQEAFDLKVALFEEQNRAHLFICTSLARYLGLNETGMVLIEVGLLSGFSARPDLVPLGGALKRVETEPGRAVLYLDSVSTQESCLLVPLLVEFKVARVQEASVSVYDYYEPRRRTVRSYRSALRSDVSSCSFCGDDCSRCRANNNNYELNGASRCSRHFLPVLLLLFVIFSA
ncbi:CD109 antigen isoform X3 [Gambusia affinis]|uniref:CD109 antigen isoform X3 n=1 Tax=Gambusia affinis TaxID=33528 RepID=UPI001CDB79E9|nr:CD109 antigen isoform X3 [Gambusia affinis]